MIPVEQTILTAPLGNCFAACVASILECPLEAVPHYTVEEGSSEEGQARYYFRVQDWLSTLNLHLVGHRETGLLRPRGYSILSIDMGPWWHSVVAKDGEPYWNPDPRRAAGLPDPEKWIDWLAFALLDPTQPVGRP